MGSLAHHPERRDHDSFISGSKYGVKVAVHPKFLSQRLTLLAFILPLRHQKLTFTPMFPTLRSYRELVHDGITTTISIPPGDGDDYSELLQGGGGFASIRTR